MRVLFSVFLVLVSFIQLHGRQDTMYVYNNGSMIIKVPIDQIDSLMVDEQYSTLFIMRSDSLHDELELSQTDSITFQHYYINPDYELLTQEVRTFGKYELSIEDVFQVENPYDYEQLSIDALFVSPSGRQFKIPAFYYVPHELFVTNPIPSGEGEFRVRFAPDEPGEWGVSIHIQTPRYQHTDTLPSFSVLQDEQARGFLKVSDSNPYTFEFQDGSSFTPIGMNAWVWSPYKTDRNKPVQSKRAEITMQRIKDVEHAGGNCARIILFPNYMAIEWMEDEINGYEGLGRYHQRTCFDIDRMVSYAAAKELTLIFSIEDSNQSTNLPLHTDSKKFMDKYATSCPYTIENGGFFELEDLAEWWTDPRIEKLIKQKLRYIMARWGYSTSVGMWQILTETELSGAPQSVIKEWVDQMALYMKGIDPHNRPVSMSTHGFTVNKYYPHWVKLFEHLDVLNYHVYFSTDLSQGIMEMNQKIREIRKPIFITEFGSSAALRTELMVSDLDIDSLGLHLHNGVWASYFTGEAGALSWFSTNYVEKIPNGFNNVLRGISEYTNGMTFNETSWETAFDNASGYRCFYLHNRESVLGWFQNENSTYQYFYECLEENIPPTLQKRALTLNVEVPAAGNYELEVWDTWRGIIVETRDIVAESNIVVLDLEGHAHDFAIKLSLK